MWYAIISEDVEDSLALRKQARPAHLARLEELRDDNRLLIAGPCPAIDSDEPGDDGYTGSLVVAQFECYEDAQDWADADPYMDAGVYASVIVKPFKQVF